MFELFDHSIEFANIVIARAKEVVETIPLSHFFDGTPLEESEKKYYSSYPERENCTFLKDLKKLIPDGQCSSVWDDYINSRSVEDLLILFEHDVVTSQFPLMECMQKRSDGIINLRSKTEHMQRFWKRQRLIYSR